MQSRAARQTKDKRRKLLVCDEFRFVLRPSSFVVVEPAGDRVTAEAKDTAAIFVDLGNQGIIDHV
jgi:hypothetical protein